MYPPLTFIYTSPNGDYDYLVLAIGDQYDLLLSDLQSAATSAKADDDTARLDFLLNLIDEFISEYERNDCFTSYGLIATYRAKLREIVGAANE